MEQDGSLKSLADRMREKAEQERIETEKVFTEQLQTLSASLTASSQNALRTMSDAMAGEITAATASLSRHYQTLSIAYGRAWMRTAITAFAMLLGLTAGGWALMKVGVYRVDSYRQELAEVKEAQARAEAELTDQRQTLAALKSETWGLTLRENENGRFIVLPEGANPATGWMWSGRPTIKLE